MNMKWEGGRSHNVELYMDQSEQQRRAAEAAQKRLRAERRQQAQQNQAAGRGRLRGPRVPAFKLIANRRRR